MWFFEFSVLLTWRYQGYFDISFLKSWYLTVCQTVLLKGGKKSKVIFCFLFPGAFNAALFCAGLTYYRELGGITPSFLCFLPRGNMQGGSHKVVQLRPKKVFCFVSLLFFLSLASLPTQSWDIHNLAKTPSAVLFSGCVGSCFMPVRVWLPGQVVGTCPTARAARAPARSPALPVQHSVPCWGRQMCSSAFWVAKLETEWTEVANVCIQLWQAMISFSRVYCTDILFINPTEFPFSASCSLGTVWEVQNCACVHQASSIF